jgi:pantoate--beta-alanine ligase
VNEASAIHNSSGGIYVLVLETIASVRAARWTDPSLSWGLVPTMGFLHRGHLALVERARAENERTAVTIFVNPTQFGPHEDFQSYPRALERDLAMLAAAGVDLVFVPGDGVMYPAAFQTTVRVAKVARPLEGAARPGHFDGVATVVAKLFNIIQPSRAYFGQKDAQQSIVLRRLVADLNFPVELIICPTVREPDGLALSSRNAYLSGEQRAAAPILYRALTAAKEALETGQADGTTARQIMAATIAAEPLARLDYVSAADPDTLEEVTAIPPKVLLSMAVFIGNTRLIDNMVVELPTAGSKKQ